MEVCGGQTHALLHHGLDQLLAESIELIHGPGCPVCVTATERIDQALAMGLRPDVILCSYGDMLRVPGSDGRDLLGLRAVGADVRVIYSPLDVLDLARANPQCQVVFFAVGFETTAPATALLAHQAQWLGLANLKLLVAHVRVAPVLDQLLADPACAVDGVLAAGHVCTVMGQPEYEELVRRHQVPIVVTGFTANDLLNGVLSCVEQLETGTSAVRNSYQQVVDKGGNGSAQALIDAVFEPVDTPWRGLGLVRAGGYRLRPEFAALALTPESASEQEDPGCSEPCPSGLVLQGLLRPNACPNFGQGCTPDHPLGAPMVSAEGACAAYFRYGR
jgi:hydrogenase expression/formation protein HypD